MAGGQERVLRRRIKTVEAMKKITRAMELIAASHMGRARARLAGTRPYVEAVEQVLAMAAKDSTRASRIVGVPERVENALLVAFVGDRGLCGAYNSSVLRGSSCQRSQMGGTFVSSPLGARQLASSAPVTERLNVRSSQCQIVRPSTMHVRLRLRSSARFSRARSILSS